MDRFRRPIRLGLSALFAGFVAATPSAHGLLNIDGTRNQLFVFGSVGYGYNSNLFATAGGAGDSSVTAEVGAELKRKAGLIGVDCTAKVDFVRYGEFRDEDAANPSVSLVLTKDSGRTTGTFSIQAYRESRSDYAVNLRTRAWNFPLSLSVRYPINEKLHLGSTTGYVRRTYGDVQGLVDYTDYSEDLDFFYAYTSKLDLLGGYRLRFSDNSAYGRATDHWFYVGATGGLLAKLTGTVRVGYQIRNLQAGVGESYDNLSVETSVDWPVTRKLSFSLTASRDFSTIATGETVDSSSVGARATYLYSRQVDFHAGVMTGRNHFLTATQGDRRDTFFSWDLGAGYRLNDHFQLNGSYTYFHNWSSLAAADFASHAFTVDVSARY